MKYSLTLQESHYDLLQEHLIRKDNKERVAFIICGRSISNGKEVRLLSREIVLLMDDQLLSSKPTQVSWDNKYFIQVLKKAELKGFAVAVIHNHPENFEKFSDTDNKGEYELFKLAFNRNPGRNPHASIVMLPNGALFGRVWKHDLTHESLSFIRVIGKTMKFWYKDRLKNFKTPETFQRQQLAFGRALVQDLSKLTCTIVGVGATGSATAILLARIGIGKLNLIDKDVVEESNLNRLHGATIDDIGKDKVSVVKTHIQKFGLGTKVNTSKDWVSSQNSIQILKESDIIFGCTDDHSGRILLNRFAYFYLTPVIDMGLIISLKDSSLDIQNLQGRISYLYPGSDCLLTKDVIDIDIAYAENMKRYESERYKSLKEEAYVLGEGDPSPSVITFTTQLATIAVNELLNRIQLYNPDGLTPHKIYFFHRGIEIQPANIKNNECRICGFNAYWGRGDMEPFLDMA